MSEISQLAVNPKSAVSANGNPSPNAALNIREILAPTPINRGRLSPVHPNRFCLAGGTAILFCRASNGMVFGVKVDADDLVRVLSFGTWRVANFDSANGRVNLYAYCRRDGKFVYLHRFILNAPESGKIEVDHRHHHNLDSRKSEIRLATKSQNQRNQRRSRYAEPTQ